MKNRPQGQPPSVAAPPAELLLRRRSRSRAEIDTVDTTVSASRRIYCALRERILDMTMAPGTRIVELEIAAEHRVSRTPVHEAVQRLAEEGLVEVVQRVGTFVARIPVNGLEDAMLVRTVLEIALIRKAATRVDAASMDLLRGIVEAQKTCAAAYDLAGFHLNDEAFHAALADIAGHPGVWRTILQSKTQVDRLRRLTLPLAGRMEGVIEEHSAVIDGLLNGASAQAADAMRDHLDHVLPVITITRDFRPDYFINADAGSSLEV